MTPLNPVTAANNGVTPKRIRLSRQKGYRKPEGCIVVARPSRWGNPFTIASAWENGFTEGMTAAEARAFVAACFESWLQRPWPEDAPT